MADEVIARRTTADGKTVVLWSDGSLTWGRMGTVIKGSPHARTPAQKQEAREAGWRVLGEVELYDAAEVPRLIAAARKVARSGGTPGDVRAEYARSGQREQRLTPVWKVYQTDRDGRPKVRVWRLPRLLYGGIVVWDETSPRGRYHVMREIRGTGTLESTGIHFRDLDKLSAFLLEERDRFLKG